MHLISSKSALFMVLTTSSNSSLGYIRSTNSLKGPCMMSFKLEASGGTPQFYAGLATNIANPNNFSSYSDTYVD